MVGPQFVGPNLNIVAEGISDVRASLAADPHSLHRRRLIPSSMMFEEGSSFLIEIHNRRHYSSVMINVFGGEAFGHRSLLLASSTSGSFVDDAQEGFFIGNDCLVDGCRG